MDILIFFHFSIHPIHPLHHKIKILQTIDNGFNLSINDQPCIMLKIQIISLCSVPFYILFIHQSILWSIRIRIKNNPLSIEAGTWDRTVWRRGTSDSSTTNIIMGAKLPPTVAWLWFVMLVVVVWTSSGNGKTAGCNVVAVVLQCHYATNAMVQQFNSVTSTNQQLQCCIHTVNSKKIGKIVQKLLF